MVQWLHFTGEVDTFIIVRCNVSSGFHIPKITEISSFFTQLFLKNQGVIAFLKHGVVLLIVMVSKFPLTIGFSGFFSQKTRFGSDSVVLMNTL